MSTKKFEWPFWWPEPIDNYYESIEVVGLPVEYNRASPEMERAFALRACFGEVIVPTPPDPWNTMEREWFRLGEIVNEYC